MNISDKYDWQRITPDAGNYLFGYYDRNPWNSTMTRHLALRIPQQSRLPEPGETAELGYIELATKTFVKLTETNAWCHQQGCMQLWLPNDTIIYNDAEKCGNAWKPVTKIISDTGVLIRQFDNHIYTVSSDGKMAASIDMARIPRRGYSYATTPYSGDEYPQPPDVKADGLFITNVETGERNLIASYKQLMDLHPYAYDVLGNTIWLNHAIFNCDDSRVMILFRYNVKDSYLWRTFMYTMNVDGSDLQCTLTDLHWANKITHQIWGRTPREILVDAEWGSGGHDYVVIDESSLPFTATRLSKGTGMCGHLIFSPDSKLMLADTYATKDNMQYLHMLNVKTGELEELGKFRHVLGDRIVDVRCDLHPRWSKDNRKITVDTIHDGERAIYMLELKRN